MKMGEILNGGDLFQLRKEYPNLKGSVSVKMLNLVADTQLGIGFNKLENAAVALIVVGSSPKRAWGANVNRYGCFARHEPLEFGHV